LFPGSRVPLALHRDFLAASSTASWLRAF